MHAIQVVNFQMDYFDVSVHKLSLRLKFIVTYS